ncbi:hypothetical protein M8J75_001978 [Diaphorina citri]|nr:hypothetical protein M8J75_001978 [Diaphorina citri]
MLVLILKAPDYYSRSRTFLRRIFRIFFAPRYRTGSVLREPPASRRSVCRCASDIVAPGHRIPETEDQTQPDLPTRGPEEPWSCRDLFAPATLPLFYGGRGGEV